MEVYDFARFMQAQESRSLKRGRADGDDWLYDTEDQLAAEDVGLVVSYERHRNKFLAST